MSEYEVGQQFGGIGTITKIDKGPGTIYADFMQRLYVQGSDKDVEYLIIPLKAKEKS